MAAQDFSSTFIDSIYSDVESKEQKLEAIKYQIRRARVVAQLSTCRFEKKNYGTKIMNLNILYKETIKSENINIANTIINTMYEITQHESKSLPEAKWAELYILLSTLTSYTGRYKKIPRDWVKIGFYGGVLEDLVVIVRVGAQFEISLNHLISLDEIIKGVKKFIDSGEDSKISRFPFIAKLCSTLEDEELGHFLNTSIVMQGESKRIGTYNDNGITYYYAIQGLYRGVKYDERVVRVLDDCADSPRYAVHFTKNHFASSIWNQTPTKNMRAKGTEIPIGEIVRFDRVIHCLTCIEFDGENYMIKEEKAKIRDRMVHGIGVMKRPKYESGLVIDIHKLIETLPSGSIMINELGTLLVEVNIPHECLLDIIEGDKVETFWRT
jgi:hypothetical protein